MNYFVGGEQGLTWAAFRVSVYYLIPFYLTWIPYVALQYMWALDSGYSNYGWIVTAFTLVPLQGFWNSVVYFVPSGRARAKVREIITTISSWLKLTQPDEVP